jgi:MFS family permease
LLTVASSLPALVAVRLAIGVGEALVFVAAATMVNDLAPPHRRGEAVSLYSLATWGGLAAGPPLGELLLDGDRYDLVWLGAAAAGMLSVLTTLSVRETLVRVAPARSQSGLHLFHRAAVLPGATLVLSLIGFAAMAAFAPLYARELGLPGAGALFALNAVIVASVRLLGRRIPDRIGPRRTAVAAMILSSAGLALIAVWHAPIGLFAGTTVLAFGQALVFPALMLLVVRAAPDAERSAAVGSFTGCADLGFAVGAISLGVVADAAGYRSVYAVAAVLVAFGLAPLYRGRVTRA